MIKLSYGLSTSKTILGDDWTDVRWFDTLQEAEEAHEENEYASIRVYGLAACLATIRYHPFGMAQGYHYFGIHPDLQEMAAKHGVTDDMIMGRDDNP